MTSVHRAKMCLVMIQYTVCVCICSQLIQKRFKFKIFICESVASIPLKFQIDFEINFDSISMVNISNIGFYAMKKAYFFFSFPVFYSTSFTFAALHMKCLAILHSDTNILHILHLCYVMFFFFFLFFILFFLNVGFLFLFPFVRFYCRPISVTTNSSITTPTVQIFCLLILLCAVHENYAFSLFLFVLFLFYFSFSSFFFILISSKTLVDAWVAWSSYATYSSTFLLLFFSLFLVADSSSLFFVFLENITKKFPTTTKSETSQRNKSLFFLKKWIEKEERIITTTKKKNE